MGRLIDAERRQRILEGFARHLMEAGKTEAAEAVHTLIKGLKLEPTVDAVEVVHGRWEYEKFDIYRCSNCNGCSHVKEVMGKPDWDYCPLCGAKMDGDGNG